MRDQALLLPEALPAHHAGEGPRPQPLGRAPRTTEARLARGHLFFLDAGLGAQLGSVGGQEQPRSGAVREQLVALEACCKALLATFLLLDGLATPGSRSWRRRGGNKGEGSLRSAQGTAHSLQGTYATPGPAANTPPGIQGV